MEGDTEGNVEGDMEGNMEGDMEGNMEGDMEGVMGLWSGILCRASRGSHSESLVLFEFSC